MDEAPAWRKQIAAYWNQRGFVSLAIRFERCGLWTYRYEGAKEVMRWRQPSCRIRVCPACCRRDTKKRIVPAVRQLLKILTDCNGLTEAGDTSSLWWLTLTLPLRGSATDLAQKRARIEILRRAQPIWRQKTAWFQKRVVAGKRRMRTDAGLVWIIDEGVGGMDHIHAVAVGEYISEAVLAASWTEAVHEAVNGLAAAVEYSNPHGRAVLAAVRPQRGEAIGLQVEAVASEGGIWGHLRRIITYLSKPLALERDAGSCAERLAAFELANRGKRRIGTAGAIYGAGPKCEARNRPAMEEEIIEILEVPQAEPTLVPVQVDHPDELVLSRPTHRVVASIHCAAVETSRLATAQNVEVTMPLKPASSWVAPKPDVIHSVGVRGPPGMWAVLRPASQDLVGWAFPG